MEESIAKGKKAKKDMSVLEKFIDRNGADSPIPSIMASDMLLAGIETTGNTLGFLLYNLATNPNKQAGLGKDALGRYLYYLRNIFGPPPPPCHVQKSAVFVPFPCFWGTPSPHPVWTSYKYGPFSNK